MTNDYWHEIVNKHLLGKRITKVEYLTTKECDENGWSNKPIAIQLNHKDWLIPMRDDEGNDGGAISTTFKDLPTIPILRD
tara:strand:- start:1930 stop:2169 length:240 start_codon:yes stop_codon:yes gene_type:complete